MFSFPPVEKRIFPINTLAPPPQFLLFIIIPDCQSHYKTMVWTLGRWLLTLPTCWQSIWKARAQPLMTTQFTAAQFCVCTQFTHQWRWKQANFLSHSFFYRMNPQNGGAWPALLRCSSQQKRSSHGRDQKLCYCVELPRGSDSPCATSSCTPRSHPCTFSWYRLVCFLQCKLPYDNSVTNSLGLFCVVTGGRAWPQR